MKEIRTQQADRRKMIAVVGIGSVASLVMPAKWSKPIIDSVILPAHAQTSVLLM